MPLILDQSEAGCFVRLEGEVNIFSAAELKKLLSEAIGTGRDVHIDLVRVTELDVSAVQLLWAAEREARGAGVGFSLAGRVPEGISAALVDAGFQKFPVPSEPV